MAAYITGIVIFSLIYVIATVGLAIFTGLLGCFRLVTRLFSRSRLYGRHLDLFLQRKLFSGAHCRRFDQRFVGFCIGVPTLKAKLRSDYFAIATLGFGEAVRVLLENLNITQGARGLPGITAATTLPVAVAMAALVIWVARNFVRSRHGRAAIAVREDFVAAEMMGINLFAVRLSSLVFSAVFAALPAASCPLCLLYSTSMFTAYMSTQLTAGVVAGGMGSITGPVVAAILFVAVPEALRVANIWRLVAYGLLLFSLWFPAPRFVRIPGSVLGKLSPHPGLA